MAAQKSNLVRAIAILGPAGTGKTTLARGLAAAASGAPFAPQPPPSPTTETSLSSIEFMGDRYVLVDAPGAVDFAAELDYALPAVDFALVAADPDPDKAVLVQPVLKLLEELGVPHALFINKVDQAQGSVQALLEALQPMSAAALVVRHLPIWKDGQAKGFVDLALERAYLYRPGQPSERVDVPADLAELETEARFHLMEQLADFDDSLMEQLLSDVTPSQDAIFADLARETRECLIAPVFLGAAQQGFGLRRLLKALRHDTPWPNFAAERLGLAEHGAYVTKVSHAGQMGKLAYARMFGGPAKEGEQYRLSDGSQAKASALFSLQNGAPKKSAEVLEGDIGAFGKMEPIAAGDLIATGAKALAALKRPARFPVFQLAIATVDRKDDVRLSGALAKIVEEDPGLAVHHDPESQEILLLGQGEPHLRQAIERIKSRFGVEVSTTRPSTAYRETIRKNASKRGRHKKQSGGHGQFGDVVLEVGPLPRGEGFVFVDKISGGVVPRQWIPAVEQGVRDAMEKGPLGCRVTDVTVALVDGSYHSVDSSEHSFRAAGRIGMSEALAECNPIMLEPIEKLMITTPSSGTPRINAAVSSRNGQILGFKPREGWSGWDVVEVYLPHAERQDFILELRSLTQGLASFEASFAYMVELTGRRAEEAAKKVLAAAAAAH